VSFEWHTRYHQDALDGMLMLTLEERGAYNTCLDLIYARQGPIPDDERWLAGWMGCSVKKWRLVRATLLVKGKIAPTEHGGVACLMNERAALELASASSRRRVAAESGASGGRKRAQNATKSNENNDPSQGGLKPPSSYRQDIDRTEEANASLSPASQRRLPDEPFELAWKAYPHVRGRSSKSKSLAAWRRLSVPVRERLLAAVQRYGREGREPKADCGAPAMDRWLRDERFMDWLDEAPGRAAEPVSPAEKAYRLDHYRATREWKPSWGERPKDAA
jgi:uncharacterized protein YdaU (DUF1376 family)